MKAKNKIIWVNFLHMYQPPLQDKGVLAQVSIESYDYLLTLLEKYPQYKLTLNICGSLLEQLDQEQNKLLVRLQKLVKAKRIELVGSAYYHPILPLLNRAEVIRQIRLNEEAIRKYFPNSSCQGFYLPEMAYSLAVAKIIKSLSYSWLILDPIHSLIKTRADQYYQLKNLGLKVVFRDREVSKAYPPEWIYNHLKNKENKIIISATDAEIYGHFHQDRQGYIEKILQNPNLEVQTIGHYLRGAKKFIDISLRPASWESSAKELAQGKPYSMWADPKNIIHNHLWLLVALATKLIKRHPKDQNIFWARQHLDRGLASCTWWWATSRKLSAFSPASWNPEIVERGAKELISSVRSIQKAKPAEKIKAEKIYLEIIKNTWLFHWQKYQKS